MIQKAPPVGPQLGFLMRWVAPTLTLLSGAAVLLVASQAQRIAELIVALGWIKREHQVVATLYGTLVLGLFGLMVLLYGVYLLWQWASDRSDVYEAWAHALTPVAAEYGRRVELHPKEGLGFASNVDGARTEVLVQPMGQPFVSVWVSAPCRQPLLLLPAAIEGALNDDPDWRLVGTHNNWVLRAELPSMARPILEDGGFQHAADGLLHYPWVRAIRHDHKGIEVLLALMPPEHLGPMVRYALNLVRVLRKVNA